MRRIDKVFWIGFVLLAALIIKGYPGFYLLMTVFCISFLILYLIMGFRIFKETDANEHVKSKRIIQLIWRIIYGWGCSVAILTLLFKVNNYPGFEVMAKVGSSVIGLVLLTTIIQFQKTSSRFYKKAMIRLLPFSVFTFLCLIPMSLLDSSRRIREANNKEYPSKWNWDDWTPIIVKESDSSNYYGTGVDTLYPGSVFKAKLYFPIREFYDSMGNNIILDEHQMHFSIGPDTFPR